MDIHTYRTIASFKMELKMMKIAAKSMVCDLAFVASYAKAKAVLIAFFHKGKVVTISQPIVKGAASVKAIVAVAVEEYKSNH